MRNQINSTRKVTLLKLLKPHHSVLTTGITTLLHFLVSVTFFFLFSFTLFSQDQTFTVTQSGGKYYIDGVEQAEVRLEHGKTYRFDTSDSSMLIHPFLLSTTSDGDWNGGSSYVTGVTKEGSEGTSGSYTEITVDASLTELYYYCDNHSEMGAAFSFPASIEVTSHSNTLDNDNSGTVNAGDTIEYTIEVENISTSPISGLTLTSYFQDIGESSYTENGLTLTFVDTGGSAEGILSVGETAEYTATYTFDSAATAGTVQLYVEAVGSSGGQTDNELDYSDNGDDSDGNTHGDTTRDPNVTTIGDEITSMSVSKVADVPSQRLYPPFPNGDEDPNWYQGEPVVGEIWSWTVEVYNDGSADLTNITMFDDEITSLYGSTDRLTILNIQNSTPRLPVHVISDQGSEQGVLLVGETATYTAYIIVDQESIDGGGVKNCLGEVQASNANDTSVVISENASSDLCVESETVQDPSIRVKKSASLPTGGNSIGDEILYTIEVENTGNVTLDISKSKDANGVPIEWEFTENFNDGYGNSLVNDLSDITLVGSQDQNTATAGTLAPGNRAIFEVSYTISELAASSGEVQNQITVSGTSPTGSGGEGGIIVTDLSEDPDDTDYDADLDQDNFTVTTLSAVRSMSVFKTVVPQDIDSDGEIGVGDKLVYTITVTNNGQVSLSDLLIEDTIYDHESDSDASNIIAEPSVSHSYSTPISLAVGEEKVFTVEYTIQQSVFDQSIATLYNSAKVSAKSLGNFVRDVEQFSDKPGGVLGDRTDYSFEIDGAVEATKIGRYVDNTTSGVVGSPDPGDTIEYTITIENTGNVSVFNMDITDAMNYSGGDPLTSPTMSFVSSNINRTSTEIIDPNDATKYTLLVGEILTFSATHTITSDDYTLSDEIIEGSLSVRFIENQITVTGDYLDGATTKSISVELSDDGNDLDGDTSGDKTKVYITTQNDLNIVKSATSVSNPGVGEIITFTITVENTGNSKVENIITNDILSGLETPTSLPIGNVTYNGIITPATGSTSPEGTLEVGEKSSYSVSYTVTQDAVDAGGVSNTFTVEYDNVTYQSDDINKLASPAKNPTEVPIAKTLNLEVKKDVSHLDTNNNGQPDVGETLVYSIKLENTGNVSIYKPVGVDFFTDTLDFINCPDPSTCTDLEYDNNNEIVYIKDVNISGNEIIDNTKILPGYTAVYQAVLTITQEIKDYGGVKNILDVAYVDLLDESKTARSTDSDLFDNEPENEDYTTFIIDENADFEITKYLMVAQESSPTPIVYDVTVSAGKFIYSQDGQVKSNITFERGKTYRFKQSDSSNSGFPLRFSQTEDGNEYDYLVTTSGAPGNGSVNSYTQITVDALVNSGQITHAPVSSIYTYSPNQLGMGTLFEISQPSIVPVLGDELVYYIKIENTGNTILNIPNPPTDTITSSGNPLSLDSGYPQFLRKFTETSNSSELVLAPGDIVVWEARYTVSQDAVDGGEISNSASLDAQSTIGTDVSKTSNDGDNTDGDDSDVTKVIIPQNPSIEVIKEWEWADDNNNGYVDRGEVITFNITINNTGDVTVDSFTFDETFVDKNPVNPRDLTSDLVGPSTTVTPESIGPGESILYTATYEVDQVTIDTGGLVNSVTVDAVGAGTLISDISDDGDTGPGDTGQNPTEIIIVPNPLIEVTKTIIDHQDDGGGDPSKANDGKYDAGEILTYKIVLENTGNISLVNFKFEDSFQNFDSSSDLQYDAVPNTNPVKYIEYIETLDKDGNTSTTSFENYLEYGDFAIYQAKYTITAADVTSKGLSNSLTAISEDYGGNEVTSDVSDDGDDSDGNTTDDPTVLYIGDLPSFKVEKTGEYIDDNGTAGVNEGDTVKFTIKIINTGADVITLDSNYTDVMYNGFNVPITPPSLVLESQTGNNVNTAQPYVLNVGEVETHIMEHSITTGDINSGGIYNSISFIGNSERNPDTSRPDLGDLSDDPNTPEVDDPAFVPLSVDTDGDGIPDTLDLDDDNDGILDEIEACFSFSLDGDSFDNYTGNNYYPDNSMDKFQEPSIAPPFSSVNSDGEIWSGTNLYQPYVDSQGKNYGKFIQLLQGAGENDLSYWDESSHDATTSFDRIVVIENVTPNTDYTVSFVQRAGVIYFDVNGGYQPGGETLLQLQSMNSDFEISQTFTPGSSWSEESFNFTTDSETTQLAILFSAYDADNPVSIHLDAIVFDYQESCNGDIDEDGVPNHLDLDSDNDGIYDVVEAGFEAIDTNLDGMLDFNDSAFVDTDFDTVHDPVFGATMIDSDSDGVIDAFQLDSDGDGCFDTGEAGYTDSTLVADRDGILGDAPYTVDSFGKINSGTDGYTVPLDFDNNGILDYREDEYDAGCFNPSMLVTKTATITQNDGNTTVDVGDVINYEITVVNNSLEPLKDIVVKDTLSNQALSFELQTTYVEELNTGNHEERNRQFRSLGNTSNPNNYTIGTAQQTGNDMQADSNNGSYWNDFSSSNACVFCGGYFRIYHPKTVNTGSIQSPSSTTRFTP